jgi:hypothetical protein
MARRNNDGEEEYEMLEAVPIDRDRARGADDDDDLQDNEYLADLVGVLGTSSNVQVTVSKQGERGKFDIIETYPVNDLTAETVNILREQYGAGVYRFRANKKGNRRSVWEKDYGFAELPRNRRHAPVAENKPVAVPAGLELLSRQIAQQTELLARLLQAPQVQPAGDTEERMLAKLAMYKNLFAPAPAAPAAPARDPMDLFMQAVTLAKDVAQPSEGSNMLDVVRDLVKGMSQYAQTQPRQLTAPAPRPQPAPAQPAVPAVAPYRPSAAPVQPVEDPMNQYIKWLLAQADTGTSAQQLAHQLSEQVDEAELYRIIDTPDLVGEIVRQYPAAETRRGWLEELFSYLNKILYEDEGGETDGQK